MRQVFDEPEIGPPQESRETEFTLGSIGLLLVGAAILVVCGLCFGLGYAVGHRSPLPPATDSASQSPPSPDAPLVASSSKQKPGATPQQIVPATPAASDPVPVPAAADPDADVVSPPSSSSAPPSAPRPPTPGQWAVKPALPAQPQAGAGVVVAPALAASQGIMVQIAAVSHIEDAEVLVNALRRRGYAVTARRDLADNLIHVQVGPFTNRNDANTMRVKLLGDGYNAIIEP